MLSPLEVRALADTPVPGSWAVDADALVILAYELRARLLAPGSLDDLRPVEDLAAEHIANRRARHLAALEAELYGKIVA